MGRVLPLQRHASGTDGVSRRTRWTVLLHVLLQWRDVPLESYPRRVSRSAVCISVLCSADDTASHPLVFFSFREHVNRVNGCV